MKSIYNLLICQYCNKPKGKDRNHSICSKKMQEKATKPHRNSKSKYAYSYKRIDKFLKFID